MAAKVFATKIYMLWFNFILGLNFIFIVFGMVMYDNEIEPKGNKI